MPDSAAINWTNSSVNAFAKGADPLVLMEETARSLVLKAREQGWEGPPFNPLYLAKMQGLQIEANSSVADARLVVTDGGPKIEFNPRQARERVRFSIAHEIAHLLFPDWAEQVRNRRGDGTEDGWQLEMLCNLAASEFVLPIGSLSSIEEIPSIEELMSQRRAYDVSAEAFLIRMAKISNQPIGIFVSSPVVTDDGRRNYKIDYFLGSPTAPKFRLTGMAIPNESIVHRCTAIGHTNCSIENWATGSPSQIECVGLTAYPGSLYPRVAGLVRFDKARENRQPIRLVHGNILEPQNGGQKVICQLVNDKAIKWGGGIARKMASKFPHAEREFMDQVKSIPRSDRLGCTIFSKASDDLTIASLIGQEGHGQSLFPRIRYKALQSCLQAVADHAVSKGASIHMPKIGTGAAGGDWSTIEEILDDIMVRSGLVVTVYELPPKREQLKLL